MRRDVSKLKLPFVSYIISSLSQGIIIIEENQGGCTRRSALGDSQVSLSGASLGSQYWDESIWHHRSFHHDFQVSSGRNMSGEDPVVSALPEGPHLGTCVRAGEAVGLPLGPQSLTCSAWATCCVLGGFFHFSSKSNHF